MPEDVANVSRINLESEALRKQGISDIFRAMGQTAQADYYEALAEKTRHPEAEYAQEQAIEWIKKAKSPEEIAEIKSRIAENYASGTLSMERANEINRMLDLKVQAEELGNEELANEIAQWIAVEIPTGVEGEYESGVMKAADIAELLAGKYSDNTLPREKFATQQEQQAVAIEQEILDKPTSEASRAQYQDFNRYSNRPKVAIKIKNKVHLLDLPKVGGKIITARDVYKAAQDVDMSVEEYVEKVLKIPLR